MQNVEINRVDSLTPSLDRMHRCLLLLALAFALSACGSKRNASVPPTGPVQTNGATARVGAIENGEASWYGDPYHGRQSASGEIYDMELLTAAHRSLPFFTWVEVTNLSNGKTVQVKINDRGPFVDNRIIDLSRAAAREIDMLRAGVVPVQLRIIPAPDDVAPEVGPEVGPMDSSVTVTAVAIATDQSDPDVEIPRVGSASTSTVSSSGLITGGFTVQAGAYLIRDGAEKVRARIAAQFPDADARIVARDVTAGGDDAIVWRVLLGGNLTRADAQRLADQVAQVSGEALVVFE